MTLFTTSKKPGENKELILYHNYKQSNIFSIRYSLTLCSSKKRQLKREFSIVSGQWVVFIVE